MKKTAKNMDELNKMLIKEIEKSMRVVSDKALADMMEETYDFYTEGEPKIYERTGALGDTPKVTASTTDHNSVSFEAFLDTDYRYTTGAKPTMQDVLNIANDWTQRNSSVGRLRHPLGKQGFWDRATDKMNDSLNDTLGKTFK